MTQNYTNQQAHTRATDTTTTTASNSTISTTKTTPSVATPPGPNLTRAQQIRALEDSMTEDERSAYLAARDMGKDICSAEL